MGPPVDGRPMYTRALAGLSHQCGSPKTTGKQAVNKGANNAGTRYAGLGCGVCGGGGNMGCTVVGGEGYLGTLTAPAPRERIVSGVVTGAGD